MWLQFFAQNFHFAINLLGGLVALGVAWLYFDAWGNRRAPKELLKWVGFGLLGVAFLVQATVIEQSVLGSSLLGEYTDVISGVVKVLAYILILVGLAMDPLQKIPENTGLVLDETPTAPNASVPPTSSTPAVGGLAVGGSVIAPLLSMTIAGLYLRRATTGLERHLRPVFWAFLLIGLSDIAAVAANFRDTTNPVFATWFAAFGPVWWLEHLLLAGGIFFLGRWVWGYLTERFFSQLFMIFTTMVVAIFMVVGVGFTSLLVNNIQRDTLTKLSTAVNVLGYALEAKKAETSAVADQLAGSPDIAAALVAKDRQKLIDLTEALVPIKQLSSLIITNQSGQVLLRAEDVSRWGDSLSGDPLVKRALFGVGQSTITVKQEPGAPTLQVVSAGIVFDASNTTVGTVIAGLELNSAFVDRIKESTGLQSSIYGGDSLAATTLVAPDGKSNSLGAKLSDSSIRQAVLAEGRAFQGPVSLQSRQMLAAYIPVKDVDNQIVGALMVAEPRSSVLEIAGRSIETTFVLAAVLLILSFVPTFYASRNIARQLD